MYYHVSLQRFRLCRRYNQLAVLNMLFFEPPAIDHRPSNPAP
jgi:hypothetical protein